MAVVQPNRTQHDGLMQIIAPSHRSHRIHRPFQPHAYKIIAIDSWETPHTTSKDNTFFSKDKLRRVHWNSSLDGTVHSDGEARRVYLLFKPSPPSPSDKMKRKLQMGMSFPKTRGISQHVCESCGQTIPRQRTFQGRLLKTDILQTLKQYIYKPINPYHPSLRLKSCTQCVVVAYSSLMFISFKKHVSSTCNSIQLIEIGTEQLRNKRIFVYFPYCIIIS